MFFAAMVMGVSGCGKSTVGAMLADIYGGTFLDGDDYHPPENVAHMAAGKPLSDDMRWPWLDALGQAVNAERVHEPVVFACSALRKSYRDHLRAAIPDLQIVYLDAPQALIAERLKRRKGHYMPASLLDSQYATLEVPQNAQYVISVDQPAADIVHALEGLF